MHHQLSMRLALTAALVVGLLAASATSAIAAPPYNNGNGAFTAAAVLNPPPVECARYQAYNAQLAFGGGATATVTSGARAAWGEFADGTHLDAAACKDAVQSINGFSGTLTDGTSVCTLGGGTYQRGNLGTTKPELNVQYVFSTATGPTCTATTPVTIKASIPSVDLPTPIEFGPFVFDYLSACNSPIAPQSCVLGPATF